MDVSDVSALNDKEDNENEVFHDCSDGLEGQPDSKKEEEDRQKREAAMPEDERIKLKEQSIESKNEGNSEFGRGNWVEAAKFYSKALDLCPLEFTAERSIYLSNRAACHIKLMDWDAAVDDCNKAIELGPPNDKPLERRAFSYAQVEENLDKALEDYTQLAAKYPKNRAYAEKVVATKRAIDDRNERMKNDMIDKLKNLGNMCLKPFGLSTDNFELTPQPGGGYSINMKK